MHVGPKYGEGLASCHGMPHIWRKHVEVAEGREAESHQGCIDNRSHH
jgi:hypothetical protein